jgi:hypothetical protein
MQANVMFKLSWRLKELPAATGLGLAFWRKMVKERKINTQPVEGAIVILDEDLREFLTRKPKRTANSVTASAEAQ